MIELRWVTFGKNRQLEFRTRELCVSIWGDVQAADDWSDWMIVPNVDGNEAAYGDLSAAGGIVE